MVTGNTKPLANALMPLALNWGHLYLDQKLELSLFVRYDTGREILYMIYTMLVNTGQLVKLTELEADDQAEIRNQIDQYGARVLPAKEQERFACGLYALGYLLTNE